MIQTGILAWGYTLLFTVNTVPKSIFVLSPFIVKHLLLLPIIIGERFMKAAAVKIFSYFTRLRSHLISDSAAEDVFVL